MSPVQQISYRYWSDFELDIVSSTWYMTHDSCDIKFFLYRNYIKKYSRQTMGRESVTSCRITGLTVHDVDRHKLRPDFTITQGWQAKRERSRWHQLVSMLQYFYHLKYVYSVKIVTCMCTHWYTRTFLSMDQEPSQARVEQIAKLSWPSDEWEQTNKHSLLFI